jgi:hypothetical protein
MEDSGQLHDPAALSWGKARVIPTKYEYVWVPQQVWIIQGNERIFLCYPTRNTVSAGEKD